MTEPTTFEILPLAVTVRGEVINSNLDPFCEAISRSIARLNRDLVTDEDFQIAKAQIKEMERAEKAIGEMEERIFAQMADVQAVRTKLIGARTELRTTRLDFQDVVKTRDAKIKSDMVAETVKLIQHPAKGWFENLARDTIKGKRDLERMGEALRELIDKSNQRLADNRALIQNFMKAHPSLILEPKVRSDMELEEGNLLEHRLDSLAEHARLAKEREESEKARKEAEAALRASQSAGIAPLGLQADSVQQPVAQTAAVGGVGAGYPPPAAFRLTPEQERADFAAKVVEALKPVKEARTHLTNPENSRDAELMAQLFAVAYSVFLKPKLTWEEYDEAARKAWVKSGR
jgi:hypothetical protein